MSHADGCAWSHAQVSAVVGAVVASLHQVTAAMRAWQDSLQAHYLERDCKRPKLDDSSAVVHVDATGSESYGSGGASTNHIASAHLTWLIAGQKHQIPVLDERVVSILRWLEDHQYALPAGVGDRHAYREAERLVQQYVAWKSTGSGVCKPVHRTKGALCTADFGCIVRVLSMNSPSYGQYCTDFLTFVRAANTLTLDTERSPVVPQHKDCYDCHLVQMGTHERVFLIPVDVFRNDARFVEEMAQALHGKRVQYWGGNDNRVLAWAAGVAGVQLRCNFVDVQTTALSDAVAAQYPTRTVCKSWTNSIWDAEPLSAAQVEYAAMDVVAAHAIAAGLPAPARRTVWVGNWPYDGTRKDLEDGLRGYGVVAAVEWVTTYGKTVAAFVTFERAESAASACNGASGAVTVRGRPLTVEWPHRRMD